MRSITEDALRLETINHIERRGSSKIRTYERRSTEDVRS